VGLEYPVHDDMARSSSKLALALAGAALAWPPHARAQYNPINPGATSTPPGTGCEVGTSGCFPSAPPGPVTQPVNPGATQDNPPAQIPINAIPFFGALPGQPGSVARTGPQGNRLDLQSPAPPWPGEPIPEQPPKEEEKPPEQPPAVDAGQPPEAVDAGAPPVEVVPVQPVPVPTGQPPAAGQPAPGQPSAPGPESFAAPPSMEVTPSLRMTGQPPGEIGRRPAAPTPTPRKEGPRY
jgi:hypothetical protein